MAIFHSHKLTSVPNSVAPLIEDWDKTGRQTGGLNRRWRERMEQNTGALTALKKLERLAYPQQSISQPLPASVDPEATELVPAVQPPRRYDLLPRCVEYTYGNNPLLMLYGASLKCLDQLGKIPDGLYINSLIVPDLQRQTRALTGREYDGYYRLFYRHAVELIPVGIENDLPEILKLATGGLIPRDRVIAVCDL
jgi:hypothetical protein